jgi:hypothetical protein
LVRELNSLGLLIEPRGVLYSKDESVDESAGEELAKAAGAELVATEELIADSGPMEVEDVAN